MRLGRSHIVIGIVLGLAMSFAELRADAVWSQVAAAGVTPAARWGHTAVWDSAAKRMIVFGGRRGPFPAGDAYLNDTWILDFGTSGSPEWKQPLIVGSAPPARWLHAASYDAATNTMLIYGGMTASGTCLRDAWLLTNADGTKDTASIWFQVPFSPAPSPARAAAASATLSGGRFAMVGGTDCAGYDTNKVDVFQDYAELTAPKWTELPLGGVSLPSSYRILGASVYDDTTDRLIVFGGPMTPTQLIVISGVNAGTPVVSLVNLLTEPQTRANFGKPAIFNPDTQRFVYFGGITLPTSDIGSAANASNQTWMLDEHDPSFTGAAWSQIAAANAPPARTGHTAIFDKVNDRMVVYGGASTTSTGTTVYGDIWSLTGATTATPGPGTGVQLTPSALSFGNIAVGSTSVSQVVTLRNNGSTAVAINSIDMIGDFEETDDCPTPLPAGASCSINVRFRPRDIGFRGGQLTVSHSASTTADRVILSGTGTCATSCGGTDFNARFTIDGTAFDATTPYRAVVNQPLAFAALDQTADATYEWNFGDGTTHSIGRTPTHAFTTAGTYTVRLAVTREGQTASEARTVIVTSLTSAFTVNGSATPPARVPIGQALAFEALDQTAGATYDWDFGDGSTHSTARIVTHSFSRSGTFVVRLTVTANGQSVTSTKNVVVGPLAADFTVNGAANPPSRVPAGQVVSFEALDQTPGATYDWDFGDGSAHATGRTATHTFSKGGTFTVRLTVTAGGQSVSSTKSIVVDTSRRRSVRR